MLSNNSGTTNDVEELVCNLVRRKEISVMGKNGENDLLDVDEEQTGGTDADNANRLFMHLFDQARGAGALPSSDAVRSEPETEENEKEKEKENEEEGEAPPEDPKPDDKAQVKEVIEVAKLPPEKQQELERIKELQGLLVQFASKLKFDNDQQKKEYIEKLQKELGEGVEGQLGKWHKLPEFGEATKDGFRRLKEFFEKGHVPDLLGALDRQMLEMPPGFPLKIAGKQEPILKSSEQLRQEIRQGKAFLDVDPTKLEDVRKFTRVTDWVSAAEKQLHNNYIDRLDRYLTQKVEDGIKDGTYPAGWRRPEGMDKETWCSAVEQAMNQYTRITRVMEAVDFLNKSGTGFKSDALDKLPPGVTITRDNFGKIKNIDFGPLMMQDIRLQSDDNRKKLDPLMAWCDKYESKARQGLAEALKDRNQVAGFGEYEVKGGWVNPKTKEFVMGQPNRPSDEWQKFNLFSYDMDVKEDRDAFGKVTKVYIASDVAYQEVPPYGYLNSFAEDKYRVKSEPVAYDPDDYVAVQTGPGMIEMIKAREVADWKTRQQIKHYGEKAITLTMDVAMIAGGVGELTAAAKVMQLGAKEAVAIGGQVLKTELATQLPKGIAAGMVRKGLFEIGLGVTGIFHNAGAAEIPWMKAVSDLRTMYFLGHATYSVAQLFRLPQVGRALGEAVVPGVVRGADGVITSIRGTEEFIRASSLAKAGALERLPLVKGLEPATHAAFNVSEKAFVGMFLWEVVGMSQRFRDPYRPKALEAAKKGLNEADLKDSSALQKVIDAGIKPSEKTEVYMRQFMDTLDKLDGDAKKEAEDIIAKLKELSKPGVKDEDKQKYIEELLKYFRYDGQTISKMQDGRFVENQFSEKQLTENAQADKDKFNHSLRKMAALAILTLSRKPDGSWPETLSSRKITVPEFTELTQVDDQVISSKKGPLEIEQKLTADELVNLLREDLRETSDSKLRTEKAGALHENGLVTGEQLGDLLLSRIEGLQGSTADERNRSIADLCGLISRLKVEEKMREGKFARNETTVARGLTAGLSSADMIKRLEQFAATTDDKSVKYTAILALTLIKKEGLDNTDRDRIKEFFLKEPPGVSEEEFKKILETDAGSKPDDKAGWERKLIASEMLLRLSMVPDTSKIDKKYVAYLQECLGAKDQPEIAARAMDALIDKGRLGGSPVDALEQAYPEEHWRRKIASIATMNCDIAAPNLEPGKQIEAAKARIKFIEAASLLLQQSGNTEELAFVRRQYLSRLSVRADGRNEPVEEVRVAAVKALGQLGLRDKTAVEVLKRAIDFKTEPSPAVRLASVEAIERLLPRNKERREILAPLAVPEPDPAVKERLARYYDPTGSIRDRNSQKSRQEVADARVEQNKLEFKPADIDKMVSDRYKNLAGSASIFDYIDSGNEWIKQFPFGKPEDTTIARCWDWNVDHINGFSTFDWTKDINRDNLIWLELIAQNRAVAAYKKNVDALAEAAGKGSTDKNVPVGDKLVSERDAAVLALSALVRSGPRMGEAFYRHRDTMDRSTSSPGLRDFTAKERDSRNSSCRDGKLTTYSKEGVESRIWPQQEIRIAEKLRDLCSQSGNEVNLNLLKDEILRALKSDSKTSDASRKVLVDGLDRLLSNPAIAPESRREILKVCGEMVKTAREVQKDKLEATMDMIGLLDKHGKASFETYSDAYSAMRTAVVSRAENDQLPPALRLRAQEMFDRNWVSVLAEYDRIPAQQGSPRALADSFLPKNFESLQKDKERKTDGYDEDVHDAVQRIIMATKGVPLRDDDERRQILEELTDAKYDDRVRMAALHALFQSPADRAAAQAKLLELSVSAIDKAIRQDAAKLLLSEGRMAASEGSLEGLRTAVKDQLAGALGKNPDELNAKSAEDLCKEANEFIENNIKSSDPRLAAKAREMQETLHKYGEGLALLANLKSSDRNAVETERLYKMSLTAFGVKEQDIAQLMAAVKSNQHEHIRDSSVVQQACQKLITNLQHTGAVPAVLSALNGYAKFSAQRLLVDGKISVDLLQKTIAFASLSDALGRVYYPEGSQGSIDQYKILHDTYAALSKQPVIYRNRYMGTAAEFLDNQAKELDRYKRIADVQIGATRDATNKSIDEQRGPLLNDRLQNRFDRLNYLVSREDFGRSTWYQDNARELAAEIEKDLAAVRDKDSPRFKVQRFIKDWLDVMAALGDKKAEARTKAEASLNEALKVTAQKFGMASPEYESMVGKMWSYHKQQGQPEKAQAFFKAALEISQGEDKAEVRKMLLRQHEASQSGPRFRTVDEANKKITELQGKPGKELDLADAYKELSRLHWPADKAKSEDAVNKALEIYKKTPPPDAQLYAALDRKKIIILSEKTRNVELVEICEEQLKILDRGFKTPETQERINHVKKQTRDSLTFRIHEQVPAAKYAEVDRDVARVIQLDRELNGGALSEGTQTYITSQLTKLRTQAFKHITDKDYEKSLQPELLALKYQRELSNGKLNDADWRSLNALVLDLHNRTKAHQEAAYKDKTNPDKAELAKAEAALGTITKLRFERLQELEKRAKEAPDNEELAQNLEKSREGYVNTVYQQIKARIDLGKPDEAVVLMKSCMGDTVKTDPTFTWPLNFLEACEKLLTESGKQGSIPEVREAFLKSTMDLVTDGESSLKFADVSGRIVRYLAGSKKTADSLQVIDKAVEMSKAKAEELTKQGKVDAAVSLLENADSLVKDASENEDVAADKKKSLAGTHDELSGKLLELRKKLLAERQKVAQDQGDTSMILNQIVGALKEKGKDTEAREIVKAHIEACCKIGNSEGATNALLSHIDLFKAIAPAENVKKELEPLIRKVTGIALADYRAGGEKHSLGLNSLVQLENSLFELSKDEAIPQGDRAFFAERATPLTVLLERDLNRSLQDVLKGNPMDINAVARVVDKLIPVLQRQEKAGELTKVIDAHVEAALAASKNNTSADACSNLKEAAALAIEVGKRLPGTNEYLKQCADKFLAEAESKAKANNRLASADAYDAAIACLEYFSFDADGRKKIDELRAKAAAARGIPPG